MCLHAATACVGVCVGERENVKLDQMWSGMWSDQLAVFLHPPLFLHAVVFHRAYESR